MFDQMDVYTVLECTRSIASQILSLVNICSRTPTTNQVIYQTCHMHKARLPFPASDLEKSKTCGWDTQQKRLDPADGFTKAKA